MNPPESTSPGAVAADAISILRLAHDDLDRVEPLWNALRQHHAEAMPQLGTPRKRADSWARRRHEYEHWLSEPGAFMLVAELEGEMIGYAMVRLRPGSPTWPLSERAGELESLSVLPSARGCGAGSALLDAVRGQLRELGATELSLHVVPGDDEALRFYEHRGFETHALWLSAPLDERPRPDLGRFGASAPPLV